MKSPKNNIYQRKYHFFSKKLQQSSLVFWFRTEIRGTWHLCMKESWRLHAINTKILSTFIKTCSGCHIWIREINILLILVSYHFNTYLRESSSLKWFACHSHTNSFNIYKYLFWVPYLNMGNKYFVNFGFISFSNISVLKKKWIYGIYSEHLNLFNKKFNDSTQ